jgi:hypothetical protein
MKSYVTIWVVWFELMQNNVTGGVSFNTVWTRNIKPDINNTVTVRDRLWYRFVAIVTTTTRINDNQSAQQTHQQNRKLHD